ncbi:MAG TPA: cation transporter [Gemmatimonadaceae bacterium]|nr:cation transporter [Gemmatimonadaceae bacterium]
MLNPTADGRVTLAITGMSCGHCVAAVRKALDAVPGVADANVTIGSASFALAPGASAADVASKAVDAIQDAGYDAEPVAARA